MQVLTKMAALLDRLAEEPEATASRLAELTGEPRSSVYRLLEALERLELVDQGSRRGTFRLGLRLLRLGNAVASQFDERRAAFPAMEQLHAATGETVFLCVRRGRDAVCIERIDGRRVQSLELRLGGSLPLHAGAGPRVLLAYEPREAWEEYIHEHSLTVYTPNTPATRERLFAALEDVRAHGYAVADEDVTPAFAALGAPIRDYSGAVRAALSVSGLRSSILEDDSVVDLVVAGAAEASRALGWSPGDDARSADQPRRPPDRQPRAHRLS